MPICDRQGFTLIELSIVLVIIGLIVGGIFVGRDLIKAAEIRATVSQIEKYKTASLTFRNKYNGLPGDIHFTKASRFELETTGADGVQGRGDGNGLIQGSCLPETTRGEAWVFWRHLAQANLIADPMIGTATYVCSGSAITIDDTILPSAKIGNDNRFSIIASNTTFNYFMIIGGATTGNPAVTGFYNTLVHRMTPEQAFQIDTKIDDGNPAIGTVFSMNGATNAPLPIIGNGSTLPVAGTHCFDGNAPFSYSMSTPAHANGQSCSIAIRAGF